MPSSFETKEVLGRLAFSDDGCSFFPLVPTYETRTMSNTVNKQNNKRTGFGCTRDGEADDTITLISTETVEFAKIFKASKSSSMIT
jgi:hypothetical protein